MTASAGKLAMLGKYLMLERVAVGGMAEVWLAKRVEPEKKISKLLAIKRIQPQLSADPEFVKMFIDEARIAGLLQHPSIAPMYELGRVGDTYYIAMEFVWGRDLLQLLRTLKAAKQAMPFVGAAHVAARLCDALHYAHVKVDKNGTPLDLVHRDVSPQNVLLGFDGQVKLIDFGIAKASSRTTKTKAGMLKGKVGYMSPEQVRGLPVDARSDVFAVGTLLYEMIAVRPLFARGNNLEAMNRVREADVPPLESRVPDVPPALARIVERALQREAAERFASADEMKQALLAFLATQPDRFESEELASWLQALFSDEHWREKEKLDALDQIARPVATPVATAPVPERTSGTELASRSLFDDTEDEESTQVADLAPYARASAAPEPVADRLSSEVFFHRDEFVQVGEANPEGPAARPLKALFRPGRASAVEAYRAPIVGREDSPASARASVPPGAARTSV
ncbi:MAG: serine/threonine protein kinase, partial [Sandaracinaceae bacterium]|nr:serine/threonine protein kinase [Sandaracinaceae bacterium]